MKFHNPKAEIFLPDGLEEEKALQRTTTMAISAHQDDIEIMAASPILDAFQNPNEWFCAVVITNGKGSPRAGTYSSYTDEEMQEVRKKEQRKASIIGEYGSLIMFDYASSEVKKKECPALVSELAQLISKAHPKTIYTHNLADKHATHVAVALKTIQAIRSLPASQRPSKLLGCEVWRNLDWMLDEDKVILNTSEKENLQNALLGIFDSQISGGKRYDIASMARRRVNSTYLESHEVDEIAAMNFAMDLTPLLKEPFTDVSNFVRTYLNRFSEAVLKGLQS